MNRIRVVGWNVQPVVMLDDGESLTPVQVAPNMIPAAQWQAFKDGGDAEAIASIKEQVPPDEPAPNRAARRHPPKKAAPPKK